MQEEMLQDFPISKKEESWPLVLTPKAICIATKEPTLPFQTTDLGYCWAKLLILLH